MRYTGDPRSPGFVGYGIELECPDGVTVDNFSIRGNSGLAPSCRTEQPAYVERNALHGKYKI